MRSEPLLGVAPYSHFYLHLPTLSRLPVLYSFVAEPSLKGVIKSSGFGQGPAALAGAIGEYFERFHFITSIPAPSRKIKLQEVESPDFQRSLRRLVQNRGGDNVSSEHHPFTMSEVHSVFDDTSFWYPSCLISLSTRSSGLNADRNFLPLCDSCGCAAHSSLKSALIAALCEFVERQSVIVCWQYGHCAYEIKSAEKVLFSDEILASHEYLKACGIVRLFEISAIGGVSAVLCLFKCHPQSGFPVKYSVGSSASLDPIVAIQKAIRECYHALFSAFYLQKEFNEGTEWANNEQNIYTRRFIHASSNADVFDQFAITVLPLRSVEADARNAPEEAVQATLSRLKELSPHLFFVARRIVWGTREFFLAKVFSPDFYVSMNLPDTNLENRFADRFKDNVKYCYGMPMPFP